MRRTDAALNHSPDALTRSTAHHKCVVRSSMAAAVSVHLHFNPNKRCDADEAIHFTG